MRGSVDSASLPAKGPAPEQPLQLQEDDRFLDEELDNTRDSAMVETERDRLIRLVRRIPSSLGPCADRNSCTLLRKSCTCIYVRAAPRSGAPSVAGA